jgi:hypothetical protein
MIRRLEHPGGHHAPGQMETRRRLSCRLAPAQDGVVNRCRARGGVPMSGLTTVRGYSREARHGR